MTLTPDLLNAMGHDHLAATAQVGLAALKQAGFLEGGSNDDA